MGHTSFFNGVIWASIQRFGTLGISFVSNLVMARLLTPDDFGTIGMLMFFLAIAQTFVDGGFGAALIQKKNITQEDSSTVFYINMVMSLLLYLILYIAAPFIADFYNLGILCELLRVMGLTILIQGVTLIQSVQLTKQMDFRTLSLCNLCGSLLLAISGIVCALLGLGVWSLVVRSLVGAAATSLSLWLVAKWRPVLIFSVDSFKQLFGFGGFMLLSSIMISLSQNVQSMIIGKLFKPSILGNFTQARNLRNLSSESISSVINQVLFPDFSKYQNDDEAIKLKLEKCSYVISYLVQPLMAFMIICASPIINIVYGHQWENSIPFFQLFCLGALPVCLQDININVIKAKGKSKLLFYLNVIKFFVYLIMMIIGANLWGIYGLVWVMIIYSLLGYVAFSYLSTRLIKCSMVGQIRRMLICTLLAGIPLLLLFLIHLKIVISSYFLGVLFDATIFSFIYILLSHLLKCEPYTYILSKIKKRKEL